MSDLHQLIDYFCLQICLLKDIEANKRKQTTTSDSRLIGRHQ